MIEEGCISGNKPPAFMAVIVVWYASGRKRAFWVAPPTMFDEARKRARGKSVSALSMKGPGISGPTWVWRRSEDE